MTTMLELADEIEKARDSYLAALARGPGGAVERQELAMLLWDDKFTIIQALRVAGQAAPGGGDVRKSPEAKYVKDASKRVRAIGDNEAADLIETLYLSALPQEAPAKVQDDGLIERAAEILEDRAMGYSGHLSHAFFSGNLMANELRSNAAIIRALASEGKKI